MLSQNGLRLIRVQNYRWGWSQQTKHHTAFMQVWRGRFKPREVTNHCNAGRKIATAPLFALPHPIFFTFAPSPITTSFFKNNHLHLVHPDVLYSLGLLSQPPNQFKAINLGLSCFSLLLLLSYFSRVRFCGTPYSGVVKTSFSVNYIGTSWLRMIWE